MKTNLESTLADYDEVPTKTPRKKRQRVLAKFAQVARTFDDWLAIYYRSAQGSPTETLALKKLEELPATNEELLEVLEFAPLESPLRKIVEQKLKKQGVIELNGYSKPFALRELGLRTYRKR